jgi:tetratricopeptide (TPR) repeat protein
MSSKDSQWISEWAAPKLTWNSVIGGLSLTSPNYFVLLLFVVAIAIPVALLQRRLGAAALLAGATYFGVSHLRLQALFSVMVVIIAGSVLSSALRWAQTRAGTRIDKRVRSILSVGACCFLAILVCLWSSGLITNRGYIGATDIASFGTGLGWWFPERAAEFIARENIPGQIFNGYSEGGFFTWRLGTKYRDYIDGRGTPFSSDLLERNTRLMGTPPDSPEWQQEAERYDINAIILPLGRYQALEQFPFLPQFCTSSSWAPVYLDESSVVFVRRRPETESLIQRLGIDCRTSPVPAVFPMGNDARAFNQWANAAAVLKVLGRNQEAFAATGKALAIFPDSAYVHYTRAEILMRAGDLADAETQYLAAAALDGANGASWAKLAKLYEQQGRLSDAIQAWEHLVNIVPEPSDLLTLGYYYLEARRPDDALRAFDKALDKLPAKSSPENDAPFYANLAHGRALAWRTLGNLKQAVSFEEETVRLTPDRSDGWLALAELYDLQGRGQDAQHARDRATRLTGDPISDSH